MRRRIDERERGSATVWVLGAMLACCAICSLWISAAQAGLARQRAEVAADFAALAGAQAASSGSPDPCSTAAGVAASNGGVLASCAVSAQIVSVTVQVSSPMTARAAAKAGGINDR